MRAKFNDFPTSAAFFDLSLSDLGLKFVISISELHNAGYFWKFFSSFAETSEGFMMTEVLNGNLESS